MEKLGAGQEEMITRRSFMRGAAYGSIGFVAGLNKFALGAPATGPAARAFAAADPLARLVLVREEAAVDAAHAVNAKTVASMVDRAVMTLSGETDVLKAWGRYIGPTDTVGVKITRCEWMRVHTEQAVIDAVLNRLRDLGVPDGRIHAMDGGLPVKDCTVLINVPSIKVHSLTGIACSIKNYINFSSRPSAYHFDGNAKLAETFLLPQVKGKTRLIIVDALKPYFGPGPQINPLHRWDYQGVMAGTDPVAMDTTALKICETKRRLFKGEDWPITPPPASWPRPTGTTSSGRATLPGSRSKSSAGTRTSCSGREPAGLFAFAGLRPVVTGIDALVVSHHLGVRGGGTEGQRLHFLMAAQGDRFPFFDLDLFPADRTEIRRFAHVRLLILDSGGLENYLTTAGTLEQDSRGMQPPGYRHGSLSSGRSMAGSAPAGLTPGR